MLQYVWMYGIWTSKKEKKPIVPIMRNNVSREPIASRGRYRMARGRHHAKLSLSNAARLSFSDLCILLFMFLSLGRLCVCVFLCSHWSLVDVPLIFFCPADHVPDWQPRVLLGMVEARSVNVKKTTTTTTINIDISIKIFVNFLTAIKYFRE